jgi:hypothetical protein
MAALRVRTRWSVEPPRWAGVLLKAADGEEILAPEQSCLRATQGKPGLLPYPFAGLAESSRCCAERHRSGQERRVHAKPEAFR